MNTGEHILYALVAAGAASLSIQVEAAYGQDNSRCPPVDLVFVMDTSDSMTNEAAALCSSIARIVTELAEIGIDVRPRFLGIAEDGSDDLQFPCLIDNVLDLLGSTVPGSSSCGSDLEQPGTSGRPRQGAVEDWGAATAVVADRFPWGDGALRVIVPISDEGPCTGNPCDDPGPDREAITNATEIAVANGVVVSPITGAGSNQCVIGLAADLALGTGGTTVQSTDPDADLAGAISLIVTAACEAGADCNTNGVPDYSDIDNGTSSDCNTNGVPDECDIAGGSSLDENDDGRPDECPQCRGHADCDDGLFCTGTATCVDRSCVSSAPPCPADWCDELGRRCRDCLDSVDCNDGDSCTDDICADGWCLRSLIPACNLVPLPPLDSDLDGVPDLVDFCPGTPRGETVDSRGCSCSQLDADGDEVNDCSDRCPATPPDLIVDPEGCSCLQADPAGDDDGDGVGNCFDECPGTVPTDQADDRGCSCLQLDPRGDDDKDGVPNCLDACAQTSWGYLVDDRGCALPPPTEEKGEPLPRSEAGTLTRTPLTGRFTGGPPCGAVGLLGLACLLAGFTVLWMGRFRP